MTPLSIDAIERLVGLAKDREICQNKCMLCVTRRPCNCHPGYSLEAAVRVIRLTEAHYELIKKERP